MENTLNIETAMSDNINTSSPLQAGESEENSPDTLPATEGAEPFLEIKYLKQTKGLTKDEAKQFAEMGMHYSTIKDRLEALAQGSNQSVKQFLESLENTNQNQNQEAAAQDINERIANEFLNLQQDFGDEIKSVADIPPAVLEAAHSGMPLGYAYLLHKYLTEKQQNKIKAATENAANTSVGSLSTNQSEDPIADRFIKSLWGK